MPTGQKSRDGFISALAWPAGSTEQRLGSKSSTSAALGRANRLEESANGGGGIPRVAYGGDHGDGVGAGLYDLAQIVPGDPADGHEGDGDVRAHASDQLRSHELEADLAPRREHAAHRDIVGAVVTPRIMGGGKSRRASRAGRSS